MDGDPIRLGREPLLDPDTPSQWLIIQAGDNAACMACEEEQPWQLLFSKTDDHPPLWLCLGCLEADIRTEAADRARKRQPQ
jgi:hypothetical protein